MEQLQTIKYINNKHIKYKQLVNIFINEKLTKTSNVTPEAAPKSIHVFF